MRKEWEKSERQDRKWEIEKDSIIFIAVEMSSEQPYVQTNIVAVVYHIRASEGTILVNAYGSLSLLFPHLLFLILIFIREIPFMRSDIPIFSRT